MTKATDIFATFNTQEPINAIFTTSKLKFYQSETEMAGTDPDTNESADDLLVIASRSVIGFDVSLDDLPVYLDSSIVLEPGRVYTGQVRLSDSGYFEWVSEPTVTEVATWKEAAVTETAPAPVSDPAATSIAAVAVKQAARRAPKARKETRRTSSPMGGNELDMKSSNR